MIQLRIKKPYLDLVKSGRKKHEIRAVSSRLSNVQVGEEIALVSKADRIVVKITTVQSFIDRAALIKAIPAAGLGASTSKEVITILERIYPYDPPLIALGVKVIEKAG